MTPAASAALVLARRVAIVLTFVAILARPGLGEAEVPVQASDTEVLVVMDRTRSMAALDHTDRQPRILGAASDLRALSEALPGARFSVLAFGAEARLVLPFTSDTSAFEAALETFDLEGPQDGVGSRADRPVPELAAVLERAREQRPDRRRVVVYVGDGEDTGTGDTDRSFTDVADLADGGVVLGYGTAEGAVMPVSDAYDPGDGFVRDPQTYDNAVSRADPDNLEQIADELGVPFEHRTGDRTGSMADVAESFEASYVEGRVGDEAAAEHDLTWLIGLVLLGLVLLELRAAWWALWSSRQALQPLSRGSDR